MLCRVTRVPTSTRCPEPWRDRLALGPRPRWARPPPSGSACSPPRPPPRRWTSARRSTGGSSSAPTAAPPPPPSPPRPRARRGGGGAGAPRPLTQNPLVVVADSGTHSSSLPLFKFNTKQASEIIDVGCLCTYNSFISHRTSTLSLRLTIGFNLKVLV